MYVGALKDSDGNIKYDEDGNEEIGITEGNGMYDFASVTVVK